MSERLAVLRLARRFLTFLMSSLLLQDNLQLVDEHRVLVVPAALHRQVCPSGRLAQREDPQALVGELDLAALEKRLSLSSQVLNF